MWTPWQRERPSLAFVAVPVVLLAGSLADAAEAPDRLALRAFFPAASSSSSLAPRPFVVFFAAFVEAFVAAFFVTFLTVFFAAFLAAFAGPSP